MREIGKENYAGTFDAARNLAVCGRPQPLKQAKSRLIKSVSGAIALLR
jgi:hypothetical protein